MASAKQLLELTWFNKDKALIPSEEGRYAYEWVDPKDPRYCETRALVVDEVITGKQSPKEEGTQYSERADLDPTADNLLILGESGDVLEALTRVPELREKYLGKVKCIYIDPPFNTAQIFTNYEDNLEHSVWLTMMRDRLVHLRKLLSDDGSIWVHLDDVENHRMRVLLDEVFGSGNFIVNMIWQRKTSAQSDNGIISTSTDSIVVYAKDRSKVKFHGLPRTAASESAYANPDSDPRGPWREGDYKMDSGSIYPIIHPKTGEEIYPPEGTMWRYSEKTHQENLADNRLYWGQTGEYSFPKFKRFRSEVNDFRIPENLLLSDDVDTTRRAKQHLKDLFQIRKPFDTPKPERLLERVIHISTDPGDVVLDVFAGSGTTAAVAQKMGRRWVTCELVEDTFNRFTKPRLEMVAADKDAGGVTFTNEREPKPGVMVPEKFDTKKLEDAAKLLRAVRSEQDLSPEEQSAIKTALKLIGTRPSTVRNWRGGGGFAVAHLAPQCFDYLPELGLVTLTEAATGATLVNSVVANLNFALTPESRHFDGKRGSMFLKVVEGRIDKDKTEELLAHLNEGEGLTLAATELEPGIKQFARTTDKACQIVHIPNDIFTYSATQEGK